MFDGIPKEQNPRGNVYISYTNVFSALDVVPLLANVAMVHRRSQLGKTVTNSASWCMSWGMWSASGTSTHVPTAMTTCRSYVRT